jgi:hypothetical protein
MNAEPFSRSDSTTRLGRIAILWRGDGATRRSATPESSRFKAIFAALADVGVDAEPVVYAQRNIVNWTLTEAAIVRNWIAIIPDPVRSCQAAFKMPSCWSAVTPSSRPISSAILPFSTRSTVVPVNRIFRPDAAGREPTRKSLKAAPVCMPPPSQRPTT